LINLNEVNFIKKPDGVVKTRSQKKLTILLTPKILLLSLTVDRYKNVISIIRQFKNWYSRCVSFIPSGN
jgi:hypothetical protein